jgi:hypothetical protein
MSKWAGLEHYYYENQLGDFVFESDVGKYKFHIYLIMIHPMGTLSICISLLL